MSEKITRKLIVMGPQGSSKGKSYMLKNPHTKEQYIIVYNGDFDLEENQSITIETTPVSFFKKEHKMTSPYNVDILQML